MKKLTKILIVALVAIVALTAVVPAAQAAPAPKGNTIVDIAVGTPGFTTLVAAVSCTGLVPALNGRGQFTVFAPTDDAFAKLGLNASNVCDVPGLKSILLYHVARGARLAEDVVASDRIRMMSKQFAFVSLDGSSAYINDAQIIATDIRASNSVIHVIDTVLLPLP